MTTRIQSLIAVTMLIAIASAGTASAGILDWFQSTGASAETSVGSFDSLYASAFAAGEQDDLPVLSGGALLATQSPTGKVTPKLRKTYWVEVSAYNSEVAQTDDSPFIGSAGTYVRDGIVAANIVDAYGYNIPHYTKIKFKNCGNVPEDKVFSVEDRLNKRYTRNVDIWMEHKADALKFGRKSCQIEVL
jgi:3D (Asp-Asp-Asp) domain-containing protein